MPRPLTLTLWDVDHTLIENGGVSKLNYALAFELLVGVPPPVQAATDGRTDVEIMENLWRDNGLWESLPTVDEREAALAEAGERNRPLLAERGHALAGAKDVLVRMAGMSDVIGSVLTGNIPSNARVKLEVFGLGQHVDFEVGSFGNEHRVRAQLVFVAQAKAEHLRGFDRASMPTILVGDTVRDVQAGLGGGARVVAVASGVDVVEDLEGAGADAVLPSLADVDAFFEAFERVRSLGPATPRL
ncbi:MAG: HAD family hydrolase [Dermatophilaceae bacterium]